MPKLQIDAATEPLNCPPLSSRRTLPLASEETLAIPTRETLAECPATSPKTHQSSSAETNSLSLPDGASDPTPSTLCTTRSSERSWRQREQKSLRAQRALATLSERATRAVSSSSGLYTY